MHQHAHDLAEELLNSPDPLARVRDDLCTLGLAQDIGPAMLAYLVVTSRHVAHPLWATITGDTGSGKSHLKDLIAQMVPKSDRLDITDMTPQALIYAAGDGALNLRGILLVGDERPLSKSDAGHLRTLYESGRTSKRTVRGGKSQNLAIEGCPAMIDTTTATKFFDEDENRRLIVAVSESPQKYAEVMRGIARTYVGSAADTKPVLTKHLSVQSLLPRASEIRIPFAMQISTGDALPVGGRAVRSLRHVLSLVEAVALIRHRHRTNAENIIVATVDDYAAAYALYAPISKRALGDISSQAESLALGIHAGLDGLPALDPLRRGFTRQDIAGWTGLTKSTLERRLPELVERDLLTVVRNGCKGRGHMYALAEDWKRLCEGCTGLVRPDKVLSTPAETPAPAVEGAGGPKATSEAEMPTDCPADAQPEVGILQTVH